jgi:AcrR family transcriptional regulator
LRLTYAHLTTHVSECTFTNMDKGSTPPVYRKSSSERREAVLDAAVGEFAEKGLHGASTETIAARAGISQPYVFKLFGNKKNLFLAAVNRVCDRVVGAWEDSLKSDPEDSLLAMGKTYNRLTFRREELLMILQACAASKDPDVLVLMRDRMEQMYDYVGRVSGEPDERVQEFFAQGMLLTVGAGLGLPAIASESEWARRFLGGLKKGWAQGGLGGGPADSP